MNEPPKRPDVSELTNDPPPFLGKWWRVYVAVMLYLGGLILLFYLFETAFTP